MKKIYFLWIIVVTIVIFFVFAYAKINKKYKDVYNNSTYICNEPINNININDSSTNIKVETNDISTPKIDYFTSKNRNYEVSEENGILRFNRVNSNYFKQFNETEKIVIVLSLPKDYNGSININISCGNVEINNVKLQDLDIKNSVGNIDLKGVESDRSKIDATCGNVDFQNLNSKNIDVNMSTGNISGSLYGNVNDYTIDAIVNLGNCNLQNSKTGFKKLNIRNTCGNIDINFENTD